jgi:HEAT repeat protein
MPAGEARSTLEEPASPAGARTLAPQGVVAADPGSCRLTARAAQQTKEDRKEEPLLKRTLSEARVAIIRQGLTDPNPVSRRALIDVLEMLGPEAAPAIPALVQALSDRDLFVRWSAARTLGRLAPEGANQAVLPLARLLCDRDLDVRLAGANALIRYGPDARAAVDALVRAVVSKTDAEFRIVVMQALEAIGQPAAGTIPALAGSLRDPDPRVRLEAARVIGRFGPRAAGAVGALREVLADPDSEVRKAASEALLQILPPP